MPGKPPRKKKIIRSPQQESFKELCNFADEFGLVVEIDKPFAQFDNIILNVIRKTDKAVIEQIIMDDISKIDEISARVLDQLIKNKR